MDSRITGIYTNSNPLTKLGSNQVKLGVKPLVIPNELVNESAKTTSTGGNYSKISPAALVNISEEGTRLSKKVAEGRKNQGSE